ncbi:Chromosome segregation in meiosis protein 3 [Cladobotryum mycophilum]|uniref:Chromosome segregation in meiosis protein n=1 Tax=Cladobotryum mycophilum TaxID=491253 RepID=A0ABR0T596_9HYPO
MPSVLASERTSARADDLDNYGIDDFDDDENPFASPSSPGPSKKRKEPDSGLGIDQEVSIQKRARVPNVKLDEDRLLGPAGIPKLRARAAGLKLKGKGHEFSDASRLLSFYQLWLDDLFPKARFLDALVMVEKAGHKKRLQVARQDWINEGKPKYGDEEPNDDALDGAGATGNTGDDTTAQSSSSSSNQQQTSQPTTGRGRTPVRDDVPDEDDLYDATPKPQRTVPIRNDAPDDDDLEALMAEAETIDTQPKSKPPPSNPEPDGDDLDALIAEAEVEDKASNASKSASTAAAAAAAAPTKRNDFADDEEAMQEMEGLW